MIKPADLELVNVCRDDRCEREDLHTAHAVERRKPAPAAPLTASAWSCCPRCSGAGCPACAYGGVMPRARAAFLARTVI